MFAEFDFAADFFGVQAQIRTCTSQLSVASEKQ